MSGREPPGDLVRFWTELYPTIVGGLSLHCGSPAVAEELAQETLVKLWQNWQKVQAMESPRGWTWRVALNLARSDRRRAAAERRAMERSDRPEGAARTSDVADAVAVREAVAALPERQRRALVLRYWADLSVDDVAEVMECAPGTVKAHTHKAVEALRSVLALDEDAVIEHA